MKIVIASNHGGITIRKEIAALLEEMQIKYIDLGCGGGAF